MEEYRYYIAIDENGSPYLEHSLMGTIKGTGQRATKYLMKIGEGAQARYLYTQQEVQAYMNRAQRAAQAQRNKLEREAAHRRAQAQEAKQQVKTTAKNAASTVKSAGQKAVNTVKDKIGVDERQRAIETGNRLNEEYKKSGNKRTAAFDKAANEDAKAVSEYRNTLLGKAETALNTVTKPARRAISKLDDKIDASVKFRDEQGNEISAKEAGRRAGEAAKKGFKSTTDRMKDEFRKKKDEASEAVDKLKDKVSDPIGVKQREKAQAARRQADSDDTPWRQTDVSGGEKDAIYEYRAHKKTDADKARYDREAEIEEKKYDKTLLGRAEKVANKVNEAKDRLKETFDELERERDFKTAPKTFNKMIKENAKNQGISEEEAKQNLIDWTKDYYTSVGDTERRDRYLEAIEEGSKMKSAGEKVSEVVDAIKDKAGVDERSRVNETRKQVSETKNKLDKAERDLNAADRDVDEVSSKIDKDNGGYKHYDELSRGEKAHLNDAFDRYADKLHARNRADDEALDARIENRKAEAEYDKTPLGKAENVVGTVKDAAKNGAKGLKDTTERMKDEFRKLKDQTVSKAQDTIDALKDKAGVDERARLQSAVREYESAERSADRMLDDAYRLYSEARRTNNRDRRAELNERASKLQSSAHNLMDEKNQKLENEIEIAEREYHNTTLGKIDKLTKSKTTVNGKRKY